MAGQKSCPIPIRHPDHLVTGRLHRPVLLSVPNGETMIRL